MRNIVISNIGDQVTHPIYGIGRLIAQYRNGTEWMVRFDNGLRFRRPRSEFDNQANGELTPVAPLPRLDRELLPPEQFEARQLLEALRVGVAPASHVRELTIGLKAEREDLVDALAQTHATGGAVRAIIGEYGFGKSHLVEWTAQVALERNFLVAVTSLDLDETPPHRAFAVYSSLMRHVRYPDSDEVGLERLLTHSAESPAILTALRDTTPVESDPLVLGTIAIAATPSTRRRMAWWEYLMGARRTKTMHRLLPRGQKFPSIYRVGNNARQLGYLLSGISTLARLAGYSGLCILVDEAESYSLLRTYQRPKASVFFQAMIYAALRDAQVMISADSLPQHRYRSYPATYGDGQALFFMFTVTRSDNRMPLESWLPESHMFDLAPHYTAQEVGQFLERIAIYHAQAYDYIIGDRQKQVRRAAAELLAEGMRRGNSSIRSVVRTAVELFDLLYQYPDYDVAQVLEELRQNLQ